MTRTAAALIFATFGALIPLSPSALAAEKGFVLRAEPGGKNPGFCIPQWSITNESGRDVGAMIAQMEWRTRAGQVVQPAGEFGTLVDKLAAGRKKDLTLNGYTAACADLVLAVRTYACRDADAVRMPCPGPIRAHAAGGVQIDMSKAVEGPMKGAVERR